MMLPELYIPIRICFLVMSGCLWAAPAIHVSVESKLPDLPEVERRINALHSLSLRAANGDWERSLLDAGRLSINNVLALVPTDFVGMATFETVNGDTLVGSWQAEPTTGVRSMWLWDEPEYNWFLLECDPHAFESPGATQEFLTRMISWNHAMVSFDVLDIRYAAGAEGSLLIGQSSLSPPYPYGSELRFFAVRSAGSVYLAVEAGKQLFAYPSQGRYVPERFPPLSARVTGWDKSKLLSEVGKMRSATGPIAHFNNRDAILIPEIVRRGVTDADLDALMLPLGRGNGVKDLKYRLI